MQTGSAFILMTWLAGAVPSSVMTPLMLPAFDVSTFCPPAAPEVEGVADVFDASLFPPHAATDAASVNPSPYTQTFRRRMNLSWRKNERERTSVNKRVIIPYGAAGTQGAAAGAGAA